MAKLKDKVKTALDENRMLVLVVQVLVGFQCKGVFEPGFDRLPVSSQWLKLAAFFLLLLSLALLLTTASYHRIVEDGEDTLEFHRVVTHIMELALIPFAIGLAVDFYIPVAKLLGKTGGVLTALMTAACAFFFWYGIEAWRRRQDAQKRTEVQSNMKDEPHESTPLKNKIEQVLTEGRVVLPGTQALLGFQLITFLTDSFEKLPRSSQLLHLASLLLIAFSAILLMTPPAYHRLVEQGEDTPHFHRLASRFVVSAMIPLALGIATEFYIVAMKITESTAFSVGFSIVVVAMFFGFWFAFPLMRARHQPGIIVSHAH